MDQFAAIFRKELTQYSNRRRFAVENALFICFFAFWFAAGAADMLYSRGARSDTTQFVAMARFGREVLMVGTGLVGFILPAAALGLAAEALGGERRRGTLIFLALLPANPSVILGAKLAAAVVRLALAVALLLPIIAVASTFGGVDWESVTCALMLCFSNAVLYGVLGIVAGTTSKKSNGAVGRAVALAFIWNWACLMAGLALRFAGLRSMGAAISYLTFGSPMLLVSRGLTLYTAVRTSVFLWLFAGLFLAAAVKLYKRRLLILISPSSARDKLTARPKGRRWYILPKIAPFVRRWIEPGMTLKELSFWGLEHSILLPIISLLFVVPALFISSLPEVREFMMQPDVQSGLFGVEVAVVCIFLAAMASQRLSVEREGKTLWQLSITSLGPSGILFGKAAAVLISQIPTLAILAVHAVWLVIIAAVPILLFVPFLALVALAIATAPYLGLYFSFASKRRVPPVLFAVYGGGFFFGGLVAPSNLDDYGGAEMTISLALASVFLLLSIFFPSVARRRRFGLILHTVALAGIAWAAFLLKTLLMPTRIFGNGDHLYWFTSGPTGVAPVIGVIPILAAVLGYMLWVMTSTFDTQVRYDTQAV